MISRDLAGTYNRNVRFRKFVEPGDQIVIEAQIIEGDASKDGEELVIRGVIKANGTRVMQSEMGYRTLFATHSKEAQGDVKIAMGAASETSGELT